MAKFDTTNASKPKHYPTILLESLQFSVLGKEKIVCLLFVCGFVFTFQWHQIEEALE